MLPHIDNLEQTCLKSRSRDKRIDSHSGRLSNTIIADFSAEGMVDDVRDKLIILVMMGTKGWCDIQGPGGRKGGGGGGGT